MRLHRPALALVLASTLLLTACNSEPPAPPDAPTPQISLPTSITTVLAEEDPAALAIATSQALFDQAPVVTLVSESNLAGQHDAAQLVPTIGSPLLLLPTEPDPVLEEELRRLNPVTVVSFDDAAASWAASHIDAELLSAGDDLPATRPPEPLTELLVLTRGGAGGAGGAPEQLAATATAHASGARVVPLADPDPRADPAAIEALAGEPVAHVLALGAEFGPGDRLRDRLAVAATGVQLPGGGQLALPGRRLIALYGHPGSTELGALGEQPLAEAIARAERVADEYRPYVDEPVVPVFELITTIASATAGPNGDYSLVTPIDQLRPWVDAAADAGIYVVLDLQPGRTDFLTQAKQYEELLREPHVGLALDPEWRLEPHQVHLEQIGSVTAAEVNEVAGWLADLTRDHQLPQKLLVLHQFRLSMITERGDLDTSRDELAVLIHADGHGTPAQKMDTWRALLANAPENIWWGWKNFYDEDQPTLTPEQTVAVEPSPLFVSYQ